MIGSRRRKPGLGSTVWMSECLGNTQLFKPFTGGETEDGVAKAADTIQRNKVGEVLPAEAFPASLWGLYPDHKLKKVPTFFSAGGTWVASRKLADILRDFDLGGGGFYPTKLFQHDRKTPLDGEWLCFNLGSVKDTLLPERTQRINPGPPKSKEDSKPVYLRVPFGTKDGEVALRETALKGPDVWLEETARDGLFMKGPVVAALKAAKLSRVFGPKRCTLIPDH